MAHDQSIQLVFILVILMVAGPACVAAADETSSVELSPGVDPYGGACGSVQYESIIGGGEDGGDHVCQVQGDSSVPGSPDGACGDLASDIDDSLGEGTLGHDVRADALIGTISAFVSVRSEGAEYIEYRDEVAASGEVESFSFSVHYISSG